jgi:hypothetical protein
MVSIGFNTGYPQNLFSLHIVPDTSVPTHVVPIPAYGKAGYITLTAPEANTGFIYVGEDDVSDISYALEAGHSVYLELAELGLIWVLNEAAGNHVSVIGAYKT